MIIDKKYTNQKKCRIYLVDDHPIFRHGLMQLINNEEDMTVCGDAENAFDALNQIKTINPDLLIVDISLKDRSGIELIQDIKLYNTKIPILVLSMHEESFYAKRVLKLGAKGYIMKAETYESVINAIRQVLKGKIYLSDNIADGILHELVDGTLDSTLASPVDTLTNRELEVFQLIGKGNGTRQIAKTLNLSIYTINTYKERIKTKLNLSDASELVQNAIRWIEFENK